MCWLAAFFIVVFRSHPYIFSGEKTHYCPWSMSTRGWLWDVFPLVASATFRNSQSDNGKTKAENPTKSGLRSLKVTQALADWSSPSHLSSRASSGCLWTMSCWGERLTPLESEGYGLERGEPDGDSVPKESFLTENLSGTSPDENWRWEIEEDFRVLWPMIMKI